MSEMKNMLEEVAKIGNWSEEEIDNFLNADGKLSLSDVELVFDKNWEQHGILNGDPDDAKLREKGYKFILFDDGYLTLSNKFKKVEK